MTMFAMLAAMAVLNWTATDGRMSSETVALTKRGGAFELRVSREAILEKDARQLDVFPDFGSACKGETGYWFSPYGYYGEWDCDEGVFVAANERMNMPMFGWATPRGAYLSIVTSLQYYGSEIVMATKGRYRIGYRLGADLCRYPYEDLVMEFHCRPAGTGYAELATIYRDYQLRKGVVCPLSERVKVNPVLRKTLEGPEIRIRQAWKPVPSPEPYQQPENEPDVRVAVTFDRVKDIVRELKAKGVDNAELCLVGWNIGGHDGRWPQYFPAEARLGGDAKLREAIAFARSEGFLVVPHGNFIEGYTIADDWDYEFAAKDMTGAVQLAGKLCWGGGQPIRICPQRAYEKHCGKIMPRLAAYGFRGVGYFDVVTILRATECFDVRHPCNRKEGVAWWKKCADLSRMHLGGFASEGAMDHFAGSLDFALYTAFDTPEKIATQYRAGKGLAKGHRPIFQIVYNGIILSNPFTSTVNVTVQDLYWQLKLVEYNGRPTFYFYSKFMSDPTKDWMGERDLRCDTDEQLAYSVRKIRQGVDEYLKRQKLQYEFIVDHRQLENDVFEICYAGGSRIVCNYKPVPVSVGGVDVPSLGFILEGD